MIAASRLCETRFARSYQPATLPCSKRTVQGLGSLPQPKRGLEIVIPDLEPEEEAAPELPEGFIGLIDVSTFSSPHFSPAFQRMLLIWTLAVRRPRRQHNSANSAAAPRSFSAVCLCQAMSTQRSSALESQPTRSNGFVLLVSVFCAQSILPHVGRRTCQARDA